MSWALSQTNQCVENFYVAAIHAQWIDLDGVKGERFGQPGDLPAHVPSAPRHSFKICGLQLAQWAPEGDGRRFHPIWDYLQVARRY